MTSECKGSPLHVRASRSESGSILVFAAVMMTALVSVMALAIDGSYMYEQRNRMASAADAAAKAGAQELTRQGAGHNGDVCTGIGTGPGICPTLKAFADHEAAALPSYGFAHADVVMNRPPLTGPFAGSIGYVEVIVSRQMNTFFGGVLGVLSMTPSARAVAGSGSSSVCIMAMQKTPASGGSGYGISLATGGELGPAGCGIVSNNNLIFRNARVTASPIQMNEGGPNLTCTPAGAVCTAVIPSTTYADDPYPSLVAPFGGLATNAPPGVACTTITAAANNAVINLTMPVGGWQCYVNLNAGSQSGVTFNLVPGNYYIQQDWSGGTNTNIACPTCTANAGVFVYFADARPQGAPSGATFGLGSSSDVTLNAATTGSYAGFLFFFNRGTTPGSVVGANTRGISLGNGGNFDFSGAVYGLASSVSFGSGTSVGNTVCTILVVGQISMGHGSFSNGCPAYSGGGSLIGSLSTVAE